MARTIQLSALGSRINKNGYVLHMLTLGCRTLCSQLLNFADLEQSLLNVVFKSGALLAAAVVEALPAHKVHIRAMPPSQEAMPFIVLSDSTLQYLLWMDGSGKSYGVETLDRDPLRQAIICPGASLVMPREGAMRTPPVLEVLAWHFIRVLGHVQPFPTDHQPLTDLLKSHYYSDTCVRLIPLRESLNPSKQGAYDWLADVRDQYGLSGDELAGQTIMSLQGNDPNLVDHLYPSKDCHFRPSIAQKAIGLLLGRARTEMMRTHPNSVHVLVVCSWNVKGDFVHQEMHATAELCRAKTLRELGSIAARHTHKPWVLRQFFEPEASDRPMPLTAFQTYIHDDKPEPRAVFKERLPEFKRTFCNDEDLLTTLTLHAGEHGAHLCTNLKQPAHRADIFRYIYHYTHGGLYIDIKFGFKVQFAHLMEILATDWGLAQKQQCLERGLGPTQEGKLPPEFLLMAIGIKKDHIFQGIIYGQPRHPLFMRAIAHAFSKEIFAKIANLEYMIFCKALWRFLKDDLKAEPRVGWNISPTYGPVYLLQEQHSHKLKSKQDMGNDGHYFVTATNITVAYTRCWNWQKGFKGDPAANERRATTMLKSLPQAVAAAMDARRDLGPDGSGALPGGELISDDAQASISSNSFEDIMEAVRQERNYSDISAEDVMRCIPRGLILHPSKPGWLSCRHCTRNSKFLEFPNDIGVKHHFARGGAHNPSEPPPPPGNSSAVTADAPAPPAPTQDAPPPPAPSPSVARARFALGMPPLPPGLPPSSEPQAASHPTAEPLATTTAAPPPHKAPPARTGPPPSPSSPFSPSSPASPAMPPPNRRPFNAFQTSAPTPHAPPVPEDTASDTSDGPPPWDQQVEVDSMAEVKYQGPVTIHQMVDPVPGPSFDDVANAMPKRDKLIQLCQSDEMFTWMHALATILVIKEKPVLGGLKVSEQLRVWQDRIRILKKPPWLFAPLNMCRTIDNTSWEEAMTARPEMGTDGLLTIAIGYGPTYKLLPKITTFFGIIAGLFRQLWDQAEMHETLETDANFEIVASTLKAIYDQTCRTCGVSNRLVIYMPKEGKRVRKLRIEHAIGDTPAKQRLLRSQQADKRHTEEVGPVSDKRQKEDRSSSQQTWDGSWWHSSDWRSASSSWSWK